MRTVSLPDAQRIVITGVGLTAPGGSNTLTDFREQVLAGRSGISTIDLRYMDSYPAGICAFPETKYRKKKENKRGTRAGCIGVYCAGEALTDAGIDFSEYDRSRTGVYMGLTEHGTVETENEIVDVCRSLDVDLIALAGFMRILKGPLLDAFEGRIMNVHPSLLPSFKGLHGVRQAIDYGTYVRFRKKLQTH